jgi:hypothetical protein
MAAGRGHESMNPVTNGRVGTCASSLAATGYQPSLAFEMGPSSTNTISARCARGLAVEVDGSNRSESCPVLFTFVEFWLGLD